MSNNQYTSEAEQILKEGEGKSTIVNDNRELKNGDCIPLKGYLDQPYIIKTEDGWLLCVTKGEKHEGVKGQTVYTMRSHDYGKTWQNIQAIEPQDGPEASYAVMQKIPNGRVYIFYNHNTDNIRSVETANSGTYYRVDSLGHFVFKYSDDNGLTWSKDRYEIPQKDMLIDLNNHHKGKLKYFWNVGKPFILNEKCYVSLYKIGEFGFPGGFVSSEGVLLCSDNILTEKDPTKIRWTTLPDGEVGIKAPDGAGKVAEEHSYVTLSDGSIFTVFRTVSGHPGCSYSRDGGKTFEPSDYLKYKDGRLVKHPRAANFVWKFNNGKFIYWFHNNGSKGYANRNPVWFLGGQEVDGKNGKIIEWGQPEILLYDEDPILLISYPDSVDEGDNIYFSETQKQIARVHKFDKEYFKSAWGETTNLPLPIFVAKSGEYDFATLPAFYKRNASGTAGGSESQKLGYTITIDYKDLKDNEIVFSTLTLEKRGMQLKFEDNNFVLFVSDGKTRQIFDTFENFIDGKFGTVSIVIDGGANIVFFVVNGKFCDGGSNREFGWSRMSSNMYELNGYDKISISKSVENFKLYDKAINTNLLK